jgi:NADPH-dependent curcumin reductase CurA
LLDKPYGIKNYTNLRKMNACMNGFFVYNHSADFATAEERMALWILAGKLQPLVDIVDGFNLMPTGLARLYSHKNIGTAYCRVREIQT